MLSLILSAVVLWMFSLEPPLESIFGKFSFIVDCVLVIFAWSTLNWFEVGIVLILSLFFRILSASGFSPKFSFIEVISVSGFLCVKGSL